MLTLYRCITCTLINCSSPPFLYRPYPVTCTNENWVLSEFCKTLYSLPVPHFFLYYFSYFSSFLCRPYLTPLPNQNYHKTFFLTTFTELEMTLSFLAHYNFKTPSPSHFLHRPYLSYRIAFHYINTPSLPFFPCQPLLSPLPYHHYHSTLPCHTPRRPPSSRDSHRTPSWTLPPGSARGPSHQPCLTRLVIHNRLWGFITVFNVTNQSATGHETPRSSSQSQVRRHDI